MNKLKRKQAESTSNSNAESASSSAPVKISRKKRVLNVKAVGELPQSLFKKHDVPKAARLEKKPRMNQGGARPGGGPGCSDRPAAKVVHPASVVATGPGVEGLDDSEGLAASGMWSAFEEEHVTPESDHATTARGANAANPENAKDDEEELSDWDSDDGSASEWDDEIEYESYVQAVRSNVATFLPVCGNTFVVQGWNAVKYRATTFFYHLKFQAMGDGDLSVACTCPAAVHGDCFHIRYFNQYDINENAKGGKDVTAVLFAQKIVPGIGLDSRFSVQSNSVVELRGRAIIHHQGPSRESGVWKCSKDRKVSSCYHVTQAKALLPESFGSKIADTARLNSSLDLLQTSNARGEVRGPGQTISYLPIHPPHWAMLKSDPILYASMSEFRVPPPNTIFKLEAGDEKGRGKSTCADEDRTEFDPARPTEIKDCKFYSILNVYDVKIEVQSCPSCPRERRRYIGPDLRSHGIFNFNNRVLVSHEPLDEYTSAYTSAKKPAWSYVQDVDRCYKREKGKRFMGADQFRAIWFLFVHLQSFVDDMNCKTCGPTPKTVIFDGISLGYGQKHVKDSLRPPTMLSEHSMVRGGLDYTRQQQVLPDALLRRRIRTALEGPDFEPLLEDLEERLGAISLSPIKTTSTPSAPPSEDQFPSTTPRDPLSTPAITRSLIEYARDMESPSTPPLSTPTKNPTFNSDSPPWLSFKFPLSTPIFPFPSSAAGPTTTSTDNPFLAPAPPHTSSLNPSSLANDATTIINPGSNDASQSLPKPSSPSKGLSQGKRGLSDDEWRSRQKSLVRDHLELVEWVYQELRKQGGEACPDLAELFNKFFGQVAYATKGKYTKSVRSVWKNLFTQLAAEESVVQMINFASLSDLRSYLDDPTITNSSKLVSIPAFHKAITSPECDVPGLNSILRWIEFKARRVLSTLIKKASPPMPLADPATLPKEEDWRKTGSYYNMPLIRHRPAYPKLDDGEKKKSKKSEPRGDRCRKYYSKYKERRLTGGIMVCWCQHSVCYGFHTIPESEGRNDVFSALVSRWREAPERVIYDFACALRPYCMTREPQFFGKTYFMIDHFHAEGHTKCSPAAFLSEYENTNPQLSSINSSAAECGNGVLRKIRKSVSYMSQERAIVYTKVFLSIWNRTRALESANKRPKRPSRSHKKRK